MDHAVQPAGVPEYAPPVAGTTVQAAAPADFPSSASPTSASRLPGGWLAAYPVFTDALRHGQTTFQALPEQVRLAVLQRVMPHASAQFDVPAALHTVGVSFVELCTSEVEAAVQAFLSSDDEGAAPDASLLDALATQIPGTAAPMVARPPCLLRPGLGIFLDGWMRFFSYRARGDTTIPLVAVDWPDLYDRLK